MPVISIVVPIYNSQKILDKCVQSVLAQSYTDFELILVNDGSVDSSLQKCQKYALHDKRIKVINKENGGVSSARNAGLESAIGKYIAFVDSDDEVIKDYLLLLTENINGADLSIGSFALIENGATKNFVLKQAKYSLLKFKKSFLTTFTGAYINSPWNKLYSLDIIKKNRLEFPAAMCMGEDSVFVTNYINCCSNINVFPDIIYFYYRMPIRSYNSKFLRDRLKMIKNYALFYDKIDNYALKIILLREYLSAIQEDIHNSNNITNIVEYFTRFITENELDNLINQIKIPFIKRALAYRWLILLQERRYREYLEKYAGLTL